MADFTQHSLNKNDIIVVATDGLWDNLYMKDILLDLSVNINKDNEKIDISTACELLLHHSSNIAYSNKGNCPFNDKMGKEDLNLGGKPDDISIIIGQYI